MKKKGQKKKKKKKLAGTLTLKAKVDEMRVLQCTALAQKRRGTMI